MEKGLMKILVIDDELPICELLDEFLSYQGFQVTTAINGEEALLKFKENRPQVVLLDIKMPGMDGLEVLRRIKEIDSGTGVIMISAFGDVNTVQEALQRGANDYLEKPIDLERLRKILIDWQESPESKNSNA